MRTFRPANSFASLGFEPDTLSPATVGPVPGGQRRRRAAALADGLRPAASAAGSVAAVPAGEEGGAAAADAETDGAASSDRLAVRPKRLRLPPVQMPAAEGGAGTDKTWARGDCDAAPRDETGGAGSFSDAEESRPKGAGGAADPYEERDEDQDEASEAAGGGGGPDPVLSFAPWLASSPAFGAFRSPTNRRPDADTAAPLAMGLALFTRMGLGVSPSGAATEAALRALSDALDKTCPAQPSSSLLAAGIGGPLLVRVRLGVPRWEESPGGGGSAGAAAAGGVDLDSVRRTVAERGLALAADGIDVYLGGLSVNLSDDEGGEDRHGRDGSHRRKRRCCCVVASVALGCAAAPPAAAPVTDARVKDRRRSGAERRRDLSPLPPPPRNLDPTEVQQRLILLSRIESLMAENERLRRAHEDRAGEIDLLRSRLALRDEALRTLGRESEERAMGAAGGGVGVGLRAAAAAVEGLRGLGAAQPAHPPPPPPPQPQQQQQQQPRMPPPGPLPPPAGPHRAPPPGNLPPLQAPAPPPSHPPPSDLPPHLLRVTEMLSQSRLLAPPPFDLGLHLGQKPLLPQPQPPPTSRREGSGTAKPAQAPAPARRDDFPDGGSALSHLGAAAAAVVARVAAAAAASADPPSPGMTVAPGAASAALTPPGTERRRDGPSSPGPAPAVSDPSASASSPPKPDQDGPGAYHYRKLKPGKTNKKNERQFVQHNYTDHSGEVPEDDDWSGGGAGEERRGGSRRSRTRGGTKGQAPSFPFKLHYLLEDVANMGQDDIITWHPHGRCFRVLKQKEFVEVVMPRYFQLSKYSSFLRQLNLYGFHRFSAGRDKGAYYHELFLRGMPFLAGRMVRVRVNGNGIRSAGNPDMEPDFYSMPPVPVTAPGPGEAMRRPHKEQQRLRESPQPLLLPKPVCHHGLRW